VNDWSQDQRLNLDERAMGTTRYGNATLMNLIGQVLPLHIEVDRNGDRRVSVDGHTD
jgi:hypothetical protein